MVICSTIHQSVAMALMFKLVIATSLLLLLSGPHFVHSRTTTTSGGSSPTMKSAVNEDGKILISDIQFSNFWRIMRITYSDIFCFRLPQRLGVKTGIWKMLLLHRWTHVMEYGHWEVRGTRPRWNGHTGLHPITGGEQLLLFLDWWWRLLWLDLGHRWSWGGCLEVSEFKHPLE